MYINKSFSKRIAILLAFVLVLTSFTAHLNIQAQTTNSQPYVTMKEDLSVAAEAKIDSNIEKQLNKDEYVEVLIELNAQVDTSKVKEMAIDQLSTSATEYQKKMTARYAVVDALQSTAEETQASVLKLLEKGQEAGQVKDFRSFYIMNVIYAKVSKEMLEKLSYSPEVASIKLDEKIMIELPKVEELDVEGQAIESIEWNVDRVGAPDVWNSFGIDGSGVVVGMIDTGAYWQHEALKTRWRGYNPDDPDNPEPYGNWFDAVSGESMPYDQHGHGTHVMGTILGQDPAGENKVGVAPGAQWIATNAFNAAGQGQDSWLLAAGEYLLAPEGDPSLAPDIINNSWGGASGIDEWYRPMVQAWRDAGILPVFSAGNSGPGAGTVNTPSNYPESYAVAATDINDRVASFSSRGPGPYDGDLKPNISAPGVNIRSAVPGGGYEGGWNGTSMASPHISGVAALLLSTNAALTVDQLEDIMNETATPLTDNQYTESPNYGYGVGLVNAYEAVASIASGLGTIEGQVLREGSDNEPPVIEHEALDMAFEGMDVPVEASITDNIAVTKAELWVKNEDMSYWAVIPMERTSGNHEEGTYTGVIPWMFIEEPGFEYKIRAYDFGQNMTSTDTFYVDVLFGVEPDDYYTDFSSYPVGWYMDGDWGWGEPTSGPTPFTGDRLIATNPFGQYSNNSDSWAMLPPLDLRNTDEASIRMHHWYDIENNFDNGYVLITDDYGDSWEQAYHFTGRDQQWKSLFIDLNDYAGSSDPVFVVFAFESDSSVTYAGWYLDDVTLKGVDMTPPDEPANLEAMTTSTGIRLTWEAPSDTDLSGYNVYRSEASGEGYEKIGDTSRTSFTDSDVVGGEQYYYVVTAYDFSNNESGYSNEVSALAPSVIVLYSEDFEASDGEWLTGGTNNPWEWGTPTSGPGTALNGEHVWATNLSGNYPNNVDSWIESPEIDLTEVSSADLTFDHWYDIERNWDFGYVLVSADGGDSWDTIAQYSERYQDWSNETVSLNDYIGETIKLRFAFTADGSINYAGWYIDNVLIAGVEDINSIDYVTENAAVKIVEQAKEKPKSKELQFDIRQSPDSYEYSKSTDLNVQSLSGLPVDAVVTVVETGRTVRTNPIDGSYRLVHPASNDGEAWTLKVESYGYYSQEAEVTLGADETIEQNFLLEPIPRGSISGQVVNQRTGEGIEGASVAVVEDQRVPSVTTDSDGHFTIENVLEGTYTVTVRASDYHAAEAEVEVSGDETATLDFELRPFIGYVADLIYDNGTAENARAFFDAGNGWAMRMTPDGMAQVTGASLYFWGTDWPSPGDNKFQVAIYDSQANGEPGAKVYQTGTLEGDRGDWNYVDLREAGFSTDRDFYIVMVQVGDHPNTVGLGMDEDGPFADRSYMYVDGSFQKADSSYGNFMIRGHVAFELQPPTIESIEDGMYTNAETVEVSGTVNGDSLVTIYNNGEEVASVETEDLAFNVEVPLVEGENVIEATATIEQGETDPTTATVIKDTVAPEITISQPSDGDYTNREVVTVVGIVEDEHLDEVKVNDQVVEVNESGEFSRRILLDEGENTITIEASDLAGNVTTEQLTVTVVIDDPQFFNVEPSEDVTVRPGEEVTISFESDAEGGEASFLVAIPGTAQQMMVNSSRIAMEEVAPGQYVGTWTAPQANFENAVVEIHITDRAGNRAYTVADGTITVMEESEGPPRRPFPPRVGPPGNPFDPGPPPAPPGRVR